MAAFPPPANATLVYSHAQVEAALDDLAVALNRHFAGRTVTALCVMNGGLIFAGQLLPRLNFDVRIDYCHATRYRDTTRGSDLEWHARPRGDLADRCVLVLDDILDEGITLDAIVAACNRAGAAEVVSAVLLDKHHDRRIDGCDADYAALTVDDRYVFGFGMDYQGAYRHLDAIYAIDESAGDD